MEVIVSISETKSGETLPRHFHNGEEAFYVPDDTTIEPPDGKQISVKAGNADISVRDVRARRSRKLSVTSRYGFDGAYRRQGKAALHHSPK